MDPLDTAADAAIPRPGEVILGKYRVEGVIGSGGMGVVLRAMHEHLAHAVALKRVGAHAAEAPDASQRLLREARAAASLQSDHVVRVLDVDLDKGTPYIVMELLSGCNLQQLVQRDGPLPVEMAVDYVLQACDGVAAAHEAGIIHRDLKPSNLFLTRRRDGTPLVKVLDFGISKFVRQDSGEGTLTDTRAVLGSPCYMSPEQVRSSKSVDERTDVWALGAILHELLTGSPAFAGDTMPSICASIVTDEPASVSRLRPDVPASLEAIVHRCLRKDREQRYPTVEHLMDDLRAVRTALIGPESRASVPTLRSNRDLAVATASRQSSPPPAPCEPSPEPRAAHSTLVSGRPEPRTDTQRSESPGQGDSLGASHRPAASTGPGSSPRLRRYALPVGVVALAGLGLLLLREGDRPAPRAAATESRLSRKTFALHLDSRPSGADVLQGTQHLGRTPLSLDLDPGELTRHRRLLTLRLAGYRPEEVSQGPADHDLRVVVSLVPLEPKVEGTAAPASTPAAPRLVVPRRVAPAGKSQAASDQPPAPAVEVSTPAAAPDSDLRSER